MKQKRYEDVRFYLFANSYPGKTIAAFIKEKYKRKRLNQVIKRLSLVLDFKPKQMEELIIFDLNPSSPYKRLPNKLKIYLEVEKELSNLVEEKLDEYSTALEDYQRQLLAPAIERVAGNLMKDIDDRKFDRILELQIRKYAYIYYRIVYKYRLPTLRVVSFITRLIS
jgi:hypothetical protein